MIRVAVPLAALGVVWAAAGVAQAPATASGRQRQDDRLIEAARRAARAWQQHDFGALVAGSPGVFVRLGAADPSAPLPPAQAASTLRAFAAGAREIRTEVASVREVDAGRGYAELLRTYEVRGTSAHRVQTLYLEWRGTGRAHRLVEVRLVR